jgi:hypothetical protein
MKKNVKMNNNKRKINLVHRYNRLSRWIAAFTAQWYPINCLTDEDIHSPFAKQLTNEYLNHFFNETPNAYDYYYDIFFSMPMNYVHQSIFIKHIKGKYAAECYTFCRNKYISIETIKKILKRGKISHITTLISENPVFSEKLIDYAMYWCKNKYWYRDNLSDRLEIYESIMKSPNVKMRHLIEIWKFLRGTNVNCKYTQKKIEELRAKIKPMLSTEDKTPSA